MTLSTLLVLGGARSGKSRYAQMRAEQSGLERIFIATAQAFDDEMRDRIAQHRADRDMGWETVEAPLDLPDAIARLAGPDRVLLIDCLTLWLSNIILAERDVAHAAAQLEAAIMTSEGAIALVANEVGYGIVPDNALARRFRDEAGRLNQRIASVAAEVQLVVAGLSLRLK